MKAVILAGGRGTRLSEETSLRPKPMVEIGGWPILWHIMKIYAAHGVTDFVVCLGYKGWQIKEYFLNYRLHASDLSIDLASGTVEVLRPSAEPWRIALVDTGEDSMTGGRLKRIAPYVVDEPAFCMTYGDGVATSISAALIAFHRAHGQAGDGHRGDAARPLRRAGARRRPRCMPSSRSRPATAASINGGFFVLSPEVLDRIAGDATTWEAEPLQCLAHDGELMAYATGASGSRWIRCATGTCWNGSGPVARRPGGGGEPRRRLLAGPPGAGHRPYRLQGRLAGAAAAPAGRRGHRHRAAAGAGAERLRPAAGGAAAGGRPPRRYPRRRGAGGAGPRGTPRGGAAPGGAGLRRARLCRAGGDLRHQCRWARSMCWRRCAAWPASPRR